MASSGKKRTTMAKITREGRLRERRLDKQARKEARKLAAAAGPQPDEETALATAEGSEAIDALEPALDEAAQPAADA